MPYLFLGMAIVSEILGTSLLKSAQGFTRLWPSMACLAAYAASFFALATAVKRGLAISTGYALWSALGTTLIVIIGALFLREPVTPAKIVGVALVTAGVVVLTLAGAQ